MSFKVLWHLTCLMYTKQTRFLCRFAQAESSVLPTCGQFLIGTNMSWISCSFSAILLDPTSAEKSRSDFFYKQYFIGSTNSINRANPKQRYVQISWNSSSMEDSQRNKHDKPELRDKKWKIYQKDFFICFYYLLLFFFIKIK